MAYPMSASSFPQTNSEIEMEIQRSSPATTTESSFASSSNATDPMVYDVFINHRGPYTKATFASPLYRRLISHGFRPFLDAQELEAGFDFPSHIVGAIRAASVHVALFSPTYTESTWCLKMLLLMLESGCPIIPVFYKVSPAELRHGNPLHALEMKTNPDPETGMPRQRYDSVTIENWRNALSIVADKTNLQHLQLSGCVSLQRLRESLCNLTNLQRMALSHCSILERLPESLSNLTNLQSMDLFDCYMLERMPESLGNLISLQSMELSDCYMLERLLESLGNLISLQSMELSRCYRLQRLPESLRNSTNLQRMALSCCSRLERLPESLGNLTNFSGMVLSCASG